MYLYISILYLSGALGHSWLDCIGNEGKNYHEIQHYGNDFYENVCRGYPRSYPGRDNRDIGPLYTVAVLNKGYYQNLSPQTTPVCTSETTSLQKNINYTTQFPMLRTRPGAKLKLWYEMDGHRSPQTNFHLFSKGKPSQPITYHSELTKPRKIHSAVFASSNNCYDIRKDNTLCWSHWTVPLKWKPGVYSIVWNWPWNQNPAGDEYNTCFEIYVDKRKPGKRIRNKKKANGKKRVKRPSGKKRSKRPKGKKRVRKVKGNRRPKVVKRTRRN